MEKVIDDCGLLGPATRFPTYSHIVIAVTHRISDFIRPFYIAVGILFIEIFAITTVKVTRWCVVISSVTNLITYQIRFVYKTIGIFLPELFTVTVVVVA